MLRPLAVSDMIAIVMPFNFDNFFPFHSHFFFSICNNAMLGVQRTRTVYIDGERENKQKINTMSFEQMIKHIFV